jgi:hypothetical protein
VSCARTPRVAFFARSIVLARAQQLQHYVRPRSQQSGNSIGRYNARPAELAIQGLAISILRPSSPKVALEHSEYNAHVTRKSALHKGEFHVPHRVAAAKYNCRPSQTTALKLRRTTPNPILHAMATLGSSRPQPPRTVSGPPTQMNRDMPSQACQPYCV